MVWWLALGVVVVVVVEGFGLNLLRFVRTIVSIHFTG